jgi:hypothetical protein
MHKDEPNLLGILRLELQFLEDGGYGRSPQTPRVPRLIFEDSPTCMNFNSAQDRGPCAECVLFQFVPPEFRSAETPCRRIKLDASGETLDSLYRLSDQAKIEEIVGSWLGTTIQGLEDQSMATHLDRNKQPDRTREILKATPLYRRHGRKCANPACPSAFHWNSGGKLFRFRLNPASQRRGDSTAGSPIEIPVVVHYWLCECCSHIFSLVRSAQDSVVLNPLWRDLPVSIGGARPNYNSSWI